MRRLAVLLVLFAGCGKKPEIPAPPKPTVPPKELERDPIVVEGAPFTVEDLRALGFPKTVALVREGSPSQNKFAARAENHAIHLYVEWREGGYDEQRVQALGKIVDENRYGSKSYIAIHAHKPEGDEVSKRLVEIGFLQGPNAVRVLAGNSEQEVLEKDLEKVARGAAEKLTAKLK